MITLNNFETDTIPTSAGKLNITFLGHGSLLLNLNEKNIYIDIFGEVADYSKLPKADLILTTHEHADHFDIQAIEKVRTDRTTFVHTSKCAEQLPGGVTLQNGESTLFEGIKIQATPAYNLIHMRSNGQPFHPKGDGNGYVLTFGDTRIYIAGDTENIPEMMDLDNIAVAFLPMNLPYTMTPDMVAEAARVIQPRLLYPYHFGKTDTHALTTLLQIEKDIEVRVRNLA